MLFDLRARYNALRRLADGLLRMSACNVDTISRMSREARAAAHHLAGEIECLTYAANRPEIDTPAFVTPPPSRAGTFRKMLGWVHKLIEWMRPAGGAVTSQFGSITH